MNVDHLPFHPTPLPSPLFPLSISIQSVLMKRNYIWLLENWKGNYTFIVLIICCRNRTNFQSQITERYLLCPEMTTKNLLLLLNQIRRHLTSFERVNNTSSFEELSLSNPLWKPHQITRKWYTCYKDIGSQFVPASGAIHFGIVIYPILLKLTEPLS